MITAWWSTEPRPGNLGDVLTPVILSAFGHPVRHAAVEKARLLATGSIIRFARSGQFVWGSGAMRQSDQPSARARYLAVRGPLTRAVVQRAGGDCPEVYGDPALLLPLFHAEPVEQVHELGVVPHYIDQRTRRAAEAMGLPVIWPLNADPLAVVDRIRACRAIVSSSLHGIVVAHAYGIPAAWLACTDGEWPIGRQRTLNGDGTKYRDHAATVGVELEPYRSIDEARPVLGSWDPQPLLRALEHLP